MPSQPLKRKQYLTYGLLLSITAVSVFAVYVRLNAERVLFRRAETRFDAGDWTAAISLYEAAIEKGLDLPAAAARLLACYRAVGLSDADPKVLRRIVDLLNSADAVTAEADWYAARRRWAAAAAVFLRNVGAWSQEPGVMVRLADMYRNMGEEPQAEIWYRRALSVNPHSVYGRFRLAEMLGWQQRFAEAERLLRSILADRPGHRISRIYLARILSWQTRFIEAIEQYRRVLGEAA